MRAGKPRKEAGRGREHAGRRRALVLAAVAILLLVLLFATGLLRRFGGPAGGSRPFVAKAPPPPAARGTAAAPATAAGLLRPGQETAGGAGKPVATDGPRGGTGPVRGESAPPLVLDEGEMRMFLSGTVSLPVVVGDARTPFLVESPGAGRAAEVLVAAAPGGTAAVSVLSGSVAIAAAGRRVRVGPGTFTTVSAGVPPAPPEAPPPAPDLAAPAQDTTCSYGARPLRVTFSWRPRGAADAFRLEVARDPEFRRVVIDERVPGPSATPGPLEQGIYYWRVSAVRNGAAGMPGVTARLNVVRRRTPPSLAVRQATRIDGENTWLVTGRTDPGAKVFVSGNPVAVAETGSFSCRLRRDAAPRTLVVEAVDPFGNAAYHRQWVN